MGKYPTLLITRRDLDRINGWVRVIRNDPNTPEDIKQIAEKVIEILARYVYSGREKY